MSPLSSVVAQRGASWGSLWWGSLLRVVTRVPGRDPVLGAGVLLYYLPNGTRAAQEASKQVGAMCTVSPAVSPGGPSTTPPPEPPPAAGTLLLPRDGTRLPRLLGQALRLRRAQVSPPAPGVPNLLPPHR